MKKICTAVFSSIVIVACSAKSFVLTDQQLSSMRQKVPNITLENAKAGYKVYSEKCANCHQLDRPGKYTIPQWNNILLKMFPKAKVTSEEEQTLIRDYLHALSK